VNTLKVILLISALSGFLVIVGYVVGRGKSVVIALILSALMNFGSYWFSDSIVLKMYNARPVTQAEAPVLYDVVTSLVSKAKIPMPKLYILPSDTPNAFATGNPEALASALMKLSDMSGLKPMGANPATAHMFIVNPLSGGTIMGLFSTHPPIEKRVERLRKMKGGWT